MSKYFIKPSQSWWDMYYSDEPALKELQVYDTEPMDTGLLDSDGNKIMKSSETIGFFKWGE